LKVLISLLGTGKLANGDNNINQYETTDYIIDEKIYKSEALVASVMVEHFKINRLYLIGTSESMWDNIPEKFDGSDEQIIELMTLKDEERITQESLESLNLLIDHKLGSGGSKCFLMPVGVNDEELWTIFGAFIEILDNLQDGDEVYFEITHLFRSYSVMSFVMGQFGQTCKKFKIAGIFYGMFTKGKPSPIINLNEFYKFAEWSNAISMLNLYGNGYSLNMLLNNSDESKEIKNVFNDFSNALSIADMGSMQQSIKYLKGEIGNFEKSNNPIVKILSKQLVKFIKRFDIDESLSRFQFQLAKWYAESANYAMAYITLTEAAISARCEINCGDSTNKDDREKAKKELYKIGNTFTKVNNIRKNIAHKISANSLDRASKSSPKNSIENLIAILQH
jgi:CRISPR-associated Csx2 family protein